ncbi:hypothetical protein H6P81_009152 [Aristolochia fimbriata]|uniref:PGG domain-containing protein n=1 Tax=Aristolochia fimbriata TaxID=158543 RepID=A0AAV7ENI7_ARIFI|nr:hypothetical protein H6P81_009152 [Aristolochia fimbriata]
MNQKLREAALEGDAAALRALLEADPLLLGRSTTIPDTSSAPETPLHVAILRGHVGFALELLDREPRLAEICDERGTYPLHLASAGGHTDLVKKIISIRPSLCISRDEQGRTSAHVAVIHGRVDVLKELLLAAPVTEKKSTTLAREVTSQGETPLHLCAKHNQVEAAKFLIEQDAELLNLKDGSGNTVLHLAVVRKKTQMVKALLDAPNVEVNAKNDYKFTPLDVLLQTPGDFGDREITEALLNAGAKKSQKPNRVRLSRSQWTLKAILNDSWSWYKRDDDWLNDMHNTLMLVATLIAAITFQTGLNPPGAVWQERSLNPFLSEPSLASPPSYVKPGTAIGNNSNFLYFKLFLYFDMIALGASVTVILVLISGFPLKNRLTTWILVFFMWVALASITLAFAFGTVIITVPNDKLRAIPIIVYVCVGLVTIIVAIHSIVFGFGLLRKLRVWISEYGNYTGIEKGDVEEAKIELERIN